MKLKHTICITEHDKQKYVIAKHVNAVDLNTLHVLLAVDEVAVMNAAVMLLKIMLAKTITH